MIYIKLESCTGLIEEENILKRKFIEFKTRIKRIREEKFDNITIITLPNLEMYTLEKLERYIDVKCISRVCLSDSLICNSQILDFLKFKRIKIFDGRWLFKYLMIDCVEYICNMKNERVDYQEISILSNKLDGALKQLIYELTSKVRILNIVTDNEKIFKKMEKSLSEEKGFIININNNYKKSLSRSNIIINYNFSEEEINKYNFPRKCAILNLENKIKITSKSFEGINVDFYEINIAKKYLRNSMFLKEFNTAILYESYIYKNTNPQNIRREILEDEISILYLNGMNGRIRKNEYINLVKKS